MGVAVAYAVSDAYPFSGAVQPAYAPTSWFVEGTPLVEPLTIIVPFGLQTSSCVPLLSKRLLSSVCDSQYPGAMAPWVVMMSVASATSGVASGMCWELPGKR